MSSKKNRDVAQELVDFLLKEEQQTKKFSADNENKKVMPKPALVPPVPPLPVQNQSDEPKTYVLDDSTVGTNAAIEVATDVEKSSTAPEPANYGKEPVKQEPSIAIPTAEFKFQPSASQPVQMTQRSKIVFNEVSTLMAGVEAVKVAQARISVLEKEKSKLRDEIDQLLLASETLQRRLDELKSEHEALSRRHREKIEILEDEKNVLRDRMKARDEELDRVKKENEELSLRFQNDLRKIRVRERELETRQEIMKAENQSVVRAKDELIIELKRQLEKLQYEIDTFKNQTAVMNAKMNEMMDRNHRTAKALRLALTVLEADDDRKKVG